MCRNIRRLYPLDPPASPEEVRAATLQFVRKITGFRQPSLANREPFEAAVEEIATVAARLLGALETTAPPRSREEEAAKLRARAARRFAG